MDTQTAAPGAVSQSTKGKHYKRILAVFLAVLIFLGGFQLGRSGVQLPGNLNSVFIQKNQDNGPKTVDWQLLWDTINELNQKYVSKPIDMQKVMYGAVSGAVASLGDPYTVFFPPQAAKDFQNELAGNFEGIGAELAIKNQLIVVVAPLDNSPALVAGLKAGDYIYKVDGVETANMTLDDAVNKIRGPAGTQVTLSVVHKGATKPVDIKITREKITVKAVSSEIKTVGSKKIGYLKLGRFDADTAGEVDSVVSDFLKGNVNGIVVDLRNNPGGYLDTAVDVASNWVTEGQVVVTQQYGDGSQDVYRAKGNTRLAGVPTVVLINGGSASASEILAGALHDHNLAKLVGEKSFGKGSVQELVNLRDQAQLKVTTAKWLTPDGHNLNKEGLDPDVKVELTDQDFQSDKDPQLDQAMQILVPQQ